MRDAIITSFVREPPIHLIKEGQAFDVISRTKSLKGRKFAVCFEVVKKKGFAFFYRLLSGAVPYEKVEQRVLCHSDRHFGEVAEHLLDGDQGGQKEEEAAHGKVLRAKGNHERNLVGCRETERRHFDVSKQVNVQGRSIDPDHANSLVCGSKVTREDLHKRLANARASKTVNQHTSSEPKPNRGHGHGSVCRLVKLHSTFTRLGDKGEHVREQHAGEATGVAQVRDVLAGGAH